MLFKGCMGLSTEEDPLGYPRPHVFEADPRWMFSNGIIGAMEGKAKPAKDE